MRFKEPAVQKITGMKRARAALYKLGLFLNRLLPGMRVAVFFFARI